MQKNILRLVKDFVQLFFPKVCYGCHTALEPYEKVICTRCHVEVPLTNFHLEEKNTLKKKFEEWLCIQNATALCYFQKEGMVASLIHQFKYQGIQDVGVFLGKWLGHQIKESPFFSSIQLIVPVPLHPKRELKRGFNQASIIGQQISIITEVPLMENGLIRKKNTQHLAHFGTDERWKEIEDAFEVNPQLKNKAIHFLLIDDVITTGATLNACSQSLLEVSGGKISIAALAFRL